MVPAIGLAMTTPRYAVILAEVPPVGERPPSPWAGCCVATTPSRTRRGPIDIGLGGVLSPSASPSACSCSSPEGAISEVKRTTSFADDCPIQSAHALMPRHVVIFGLGQRPRGDGSIFATAQCLFAGTL